MLSAHEGVCIRVGNRTSETLGSLDGVSDGDALRFANGSVLGLLQSITECLEIVTLSITILVQNLHPNRHHPRSQDNDFATIQVAQGFHLTTKGAFLLA